MTTNDVRQMLEKHACWIDGTRYTFDLEWVAVEKDADVALARLLLRVSAMAHHLPRDMPAAQLHVLASAGKVTDLLKLLTDALHQHLAESSSPRARQSVTSGECDGVLG